MQAMQTYGHHGIGAHLFAPLMPKYQDLQLHLPPGVLLRELVSPIITEDRMGYC